MMGTVYINKDGERGVTDPQLTPHCPNANTYKMEGLQ